MIDKVCYLCVYLKANVTFKWFSVMLTAYFFLQSIFLFTCVDIWLTLWTVSMQMFQFVFSVYNSVNIKLCETDIKPAKLLGKEPIYEWSLLWLLVPWNFSLKLDGMFIIDTTAVVTVRTERPFIPLIPVLPLFREFYRGRHLVWLSLFVSSISYSNLM